MITVTIYMDNDESSMIGTLTCSTDEEKSRSRDRLALAGIGPDGRKVVSHEISRKISYLDYLKRLMPQQRGDAIFDLAQRSWGTGNPKFLDHAKLASELERLGISELAEADLACQVGPVEFDGRRSTVH
ncbi:MAG TPA: hypothetical protein VE641_16570 [Chthoniobacterales bacterium]|nr:hypothetical protein [Chthoniobacterales bacterium]